jgi:hypothetical protein
MNDSIFVENSGLNTLEKSYRYKIELINLSSASTDTIGNTQASSVRLTLTPNDNQLTLNWTANVPWTNYKTWIYRKTPTENDFSYLDTTSAVSYIDTGLQNGLSYCYYIITLGTYSSPSINNSLYNTSQEICGIPQDTTPPCQPELTVIPSCDEFQNDLSWQAKNQTCLWRSRCQNLFNILRLFTLQTDSLKRQCKSTQTGLGRSAVARQQSFIVPTLKRQQTAGRNGTQHDSTDHGARFPTQTAHVQNMVS